MQKLIAVHFDEFGKHNRHSRPVVAKHIVVIGIVIGEHEMEAITQILMTVVFKNLAVLYKFKVNAVSKTPNDIGAYPHFRAMPQMNAISGAGLAHGLAAHLIQGTQSLGLENADSRCIGGTCVTCLLNGKVIPAC